MKKKTPAPAADPDPWKEKLQDALKKERPSPRRWGFWLGLVLLAFIALLAWWLYPRPAPPLPPLVTFDALILPGDEAPVAARFEPADEAPTPRLEGRSIVFSEKRLPVPGQELGHAEAALGSDLAVTATLKVAADLPQVAFGAVCRGKDGQESVKDEAQIFIRPAKSALLVVSVEETLSLAGLEEWGKGNLSAVVGVPEAPGGLQAAAKAGFQVVYLALDSEKALTYQNMRNWVRSRAGEGTGALPAGPILARPEYPGAADTAYAAVLADLKQRFSGARIAVSGSVASARRFQAAGWRTIVVGPGEAAPGIERVRSWEELGRLVAAKK
jgi:hypothetical protein